MSSKTLALIEKYERNLREQDEDSIGLDDVTDIQDEPVQDEVIPMTSAGENEYISNMIDAALFEPSSEEAQTLTNLQSVMKMKKYRNAREEILPLVLNIISPSSDAKDIRSTLNTIE